MSTRSDALTDEFTEWLDRYSPRRALQSNESALAAEITALMRVILSMAPDKDYLEWLEKVTSGLDRQMKTSAWPTVSEVGAVCSNINKHNALNSGKSNEFKLDPIKINADRMNRDESIGDGWLYGRNCIELMKSGRVTQETLRRYRSALYFSAKDVGGEDYARKMEVNWVARHDEAESLDRKIQAVPSGEPFKRIPQHDNDKTADEMGF